MIRARKITYIYFIFILMIMIPGCKQIKEEDLYGTWVAKYPFGTEKLVLYSNGEYYQHVNVIFNGISKSTTNKGRWKYDIQDRNITLENALVVDDGFGKLKKDYNIPYVGYIVSPVSKLFPWSPLKIETNPDCGYFFVKEKDDSPMK